jgi:hypothetical protein
MAVNAYEQHRQNQFHAPLQAQDAPVCAENLRATHSTTEYSGWPNAEPCVVISETEARRLVAAIDNCWPSDVIAIIQRQPWFREIRAGIRATRHLKPVSYLRLSDRSSQLSTSLNSTFYFLWT